VGAIDAKSDPFSLAMAMVFVVDIHCMRGEAAKGEELARAVVAMCEEKGYPFWLSMGNRILGWALVEQGHVKEGIELMERDLPRFVGPQAQMVRFRVLLGLADGYEKMGETQRAFGLLDQWLAVRDQIGLGVADPFYHRVRGRLFLQTGDDDEAEKNFCKSIEVAASHSVRSEELRSALDLARLLTKHGRRNEARAMLAEIYGWFTEGFDTTDLKEARSILEELEVDGVR
jgi:ATP/maltotriose-dependent transcriptional regulator MalT